MDFKELEYILVIAQEKNISKAAERLYITQPALSRFLLRLEGQLGTALFLRKNRQYVPTYVGELYLEMARTVLATKQSFDTKLERFLKYKGGAVSLGITPGRGRTILPKILPGFRAAFPDFELNLYEEDVETLERLLQNGTVEVAVFTVADRLDRKNRDFRYEQIAKEEIVLCTPKDERYSLLAAADPARKYPWIDLRMFKDSCFLLLKDNMRLGRFAVSLLESYKIKPQVMELNTIDTILALVAQGYGVAFASSYRIEEHATANDLNIFSFGDELVTWDVVAACRKDYLLDGPARHLIHLISETDRDAFGDQKSLPYGCG